MNNRQEDPVTPEGIFNVLLALWPNILLAFSLIFVRLDEFAEPEPYRRMRPAGHLKSSLRNFILGGGCMVRTSSHNYHLVMSQAK
jgi:hypothetical protein